MTIIGKSLTIKNQWELLTGDDEVGFSNAEHLNKLVRSLYMNSFSYNLLQKEIFLKLDKTNIKNTFNFPR